MMYIYMSVDIPEPKEDYQKKLMKFLEQIPLDGSEIRSGTPAIQKPTQEKIDQKKGQLKTDSRFLKYTGWTHEGLLKKWLVDGTTTCNELCGKCAIEMGYTAKDGVGRFDIADLLMGRGLGHVWVPADSNSTPEYGDIFRLYDPTPKPPNKNPLNHMGVSLYVNGTDWYTVESGQGGASSGYDALMRKKGTWKPSSLRGWVSMKALLNAGKPLPYWLGGWWVVDEGAYETYYYYFAAGNKVTCTDSPPLAITSPPVGTHLVGNCSVRGFFDVDISWQSADVDESFRIIDQDQQKRRYVMQGKTARGIPLKAKKLLGKDRFG